MLCANLLSTNPRLPLQEAEAAAFEQAEEGVQHRQQAECRRLQETLAVVQRMQQLFVVSAQCAGKQARHLQPWWATSLVSGRYQVLLCGTLQEADCKKRTVLQPSSASTGPP